MPTRPARFAAAALALLAALCAATPAAAGSQSSNSSSNCSNGFCTRVETFERGRGHYREGWTRVDQWEERRRPRRHRGERPSWHDGGWHPHPHVHRDDPYRHGPPRRSRRDRDDD